MSSGYSNGSGGMITDWEDMDTWLDQETTKFAPFDPVLASKLDEAKVRVGTAAGRHKRVNDLHESSLNARKRYEESHAPADASVWKTRAKVLDESVEEVRPMLWPDRYVG